MPHWRALELELEARVARLGSRGAAAAAATPPPSGVCGVSCVAHWQVATCTCMAGAPKGPSAFPPTPPRATSSGMWCPAAHVSQILATRCHAPRRTVWWVRPPPAVWRWAQRWRLQPLGPTQWPSFKVRAVPLKTVGQQSVLLTPESLARLLAHSAAHCPVALCLSTAWLAAALQAGSGFESPTWIMVDCVCAQTALW